MCRKGRFRREGHNYCLCAYTFNSFWGVDRPLLISVCCLPSIDYEYDYDHNFVSVWGLCPRPPHLGLPTIGQTITPFLESLRTGLSSATANAESRLNSQCNLLLTPKLAFPVQPSYC